MNHDNLSSCLSHDFEPLNSDQQVEFLQWYTHEEFSKNNASQVQIVNYLYVHYIPLVLIVRL